ncbi:redox-active disulfide protein 2 [Oleidesulfovibrio alaskensis G20]|jgi:small redox-active disulfide protein 2|uniref:Redox-active disulfide protein 2 n=1 Tax=Oleidesulfovibrio alaskensis (strain ATCC BAA-1058 / DSM 17464 / G20) TaxID=207559 RepID=Q30XM2_OLEA2|nr:thioredoxin family protein [Oleidesulfovibrio alaskensis]ABB39574.1 redox-active disulfide protein 2 [Oleidesulfovibrio alaskensis G20]
MKIQVMGPGCPKCAEAEKNVKEAVAEAGVEAEVIKVSDFQEIASFGVFSTPAVAIDGEVKVVGKAPSKKEVLSWLK